MRKRTVPSNSGHLAVPLGAAEGLRLKALNVYRTQETLSLDLRFEAGFTLELSFENRFRVSAQAFRFSPGNAELLADLAPKRVRTP